MSETETDLIGIGRSINLLTCKFIPLLNYLVMVVLVIDVEELAVALVTRDVGDSSVPSHSLWIVYVRGGPTRGRGRALTLRD